MARLVALLALLAIVIGIAALAVTSERAEAVSYSRSCSETVEPADNGGQGEVTCNLTVTDLPPPLQDFSLTIVVTYADRSGDGDPGPGDRLKCVTATGTGPFGRTINITRCRPVPTPTPLSPPASP